MLQFNRWQVISVIILIFLGAYFTAPNFVSEDHSIPGMANSRVTLGLDLQGGSYLLLEVNTDKVISDRLQSTQSDIRSQLRGSGNDRRIAFGRLDFTENEVIVPITNEADYEDAYERLRTLSRPLGGLGTMGGVGRDFRVSRGENNTVIIEMTDEARRFYADSAVVDSIEVIRRRIDALGTTEPQIQRQGENRLVLQVPGNSDSQALRNLIDQQGQLTFHMVDATVDPYGPLPPRRIALPLVEGGSQLGMLVLFETPEVTGDMVTDASASPNSDGAGYQVNFSFDGRGTRRFRDVTTENIGRQFAIVLDNEIISAPRIISPITGGSGRITGNFTPQEATELSILIRAGALPAELTTIEQRTVGPDLGADSVNAGTRALIIGFLGVVIYIVITYGRFGIYADLALFANVLLIAGALSLLGATLTLPGIAGIVLTIGMAVDANVLIFERIREELEGGKNPVMAVEQGYRHAWSAIFDANLTTLIAALIMFQLGAGPVRGFAVTLGIGVITSVFTAFVLTRMMAGNYVLSKRPKELKL